MQVSQIFVRRLRCGVIWKDRFGIDPRGLPNTLFRFLMVVVEDAGRKGRLAEVIAEEITDKEITLISM